MMEQETVNRLKELLQGDPEGETETERTGFLKTNKLSVEKFAASIGVTRTIVYHYLSNKKRPTLSTLVKICERLGITLAEGKAIITPRETGRQPQKV
jgi:transcriptional regulator with XRE-family HTH domain